MPDYAIKISTPADLSGAVATVTSLEKIEHTAGDVTTAAAGAGGAMDRLAQAAARTPNASLESLAASAQKAAGNIQHAGEATGRFVDQAGRLREANGQFVSLGNAAKTAEGVLSGANFGFGVGFGEKIIGGLEDIGHHVEEFFRRGIEGNAELQTSIIGLGATLRSVQPEKYLSFEAAEREGAQRIDMLRDKANSLGVGMTSLVEAYSANMRALIEGGVTNVSQQMTLVATVAQAEMSKGVSGMQALRDSIDIFNGRAGNITIAKELGLTSEGLKDAAEKGQLYQYVMGTLPGYQEAAAAGADSFTGSLTTVRNELDKLAQDASKPIFDKLLASLQSLKGVLGTPQASGLAKGIGDTIGQYVEVGQDAVASLDRFMEAHPWLKKLSEISNLMTPEGLVFGGAKRNVDFETAKAETESQDKQFASVTDQIGNAKDPKAEAEAWAALGKAIEEARTRESKETGEAADQARQYREILQGIQADFGNYVGKAPVDTSATDKRAKQDADAFEKYNARPAAAAGGDDPAAVASADKHAKSVDALAKSLEKEFGFTEATARNLADERLSRAENTKEAVALNKELDGILAKQERIASSADIGSKLKGVYGKILGGLGQDGPGAGLSEQPTDANFAAVTSAVQSLPAPADDKAAVDTKKALVDLLKQAATLQEDYNRAVDREKADAKAGQDTANRRAAALADEKEETAILAARGRGEKDLADKLEEQRDIRREIARLQREGVGYTEAQAAAEKKITEEKNAQHRKEQDRADNRPARHEREPEHRRGDRETFTIHGYHDPDNDTTLPHTHANRHAVDNGGLLAGHLHTGGLESGGLETGGLHRADEGRGLGGNRALFSGTLDGKPSFDRLNSQVHPAFTAEQALDKAPSAADALAKAVPVSDILRGLPSAGFPTPTASSALAPAISTLASPVPGAAGAALPPTGGNPADAAQSAYGAGQSALSAAKAAVSGAGGGNGQAGQLNALEGKFKQLESEFQEVKKKAEEAHSQNQNRS